MALIEIQMTSGRFSDRVWALLSAAPIPIGQLNGLGADRLIAALSWNGVEIGPAPSGFSAPTGTVTARASITLRHVSIAELDADANAQGTTTDAFAWLVITAFKVSLNVDLIQADVTNAAPQTFSYPLRIATLSVPEIATAGIIEKAALVLGNGKVTMQFATAQSDTIPTTPLDLLSQVPSDDWAIRVSGEALAELLLAGLQEFADHPPDGTVMVDSPTADWTFDILGGASWRAVGGLGLEVIDACADVDFSVAVGAALTFSPDLSVTPPTLQMELRVTADVSDWDTFKCWAISGGLGSLLLGAIATPIAGVVAGIVSLIAISETVRLVAKEYLQEAEPQNGFQEIASTDSSVTYSAVENLPTLASLPLGGTDTATVGLFGLVVTGQMAFPAAQHAVSFDPDGGKLAAGFTMDFECATLSWITEVYAQGVEVSDSVSVAGFQLGFVPVKTFPTTSVLPAGFCAIEPDIPGTSPGPRHFDFDCSDALDPGFTGRIFLHTSAGIRRFDIGPLVGLENPTAEDYFKAVAACKRLTRDFKQWDELQWLIDPPPFQYGYPAMRMWLVSFAELPAGGVIGIRQYRNEKEISAPISLRSDTTRAAAIELVTDANTELVIEHQLPHLPTGRVHQGWLLPTRIIALGGRPTGLARYGALVGVQLEDGVVSIDLNTGAVSRRMGDLHLRRSAQGVVLLVENRTSVFGHIARRVGARLSEHPHAPRAASAPLPFSLALANGKIITVHQDRLVIGLPWGAARTSAGRSRMARSPRLCR